MHIRDPRETARLTAMNPKRYTWMACPLTRNIRKHSPGLMEDMLRRAARMHMKGAKEADFVESQREDGLTFVLKRSFPNKSMDGVTSGSLANAIRTMMGQKTYTTEDSLPETNVELRTQIDAPGWSLNQAKLRIEALPLTVIHSIINDDLTLSQIIDTPYLDGFSIHSVCWDGKIYRQRQELTEDLKAHLWTADDKERVQIMLEGAHDYRRIQIPS